MNKSSRLIITAAAIAGLYSGALAVRAFADDTPGKSDSSKADPAKHGCKGLNSCQGKGGCKTSDNGCKGKNSCKGKGGCKSAAVEHSCAGKNDCKGKGGCKTSDEGCKGKNSCKGKGGCKAA